MTTAASLALDSHNLLMDSAAKLSKMAGTALKSATKVTGLPGVFLSGGAAAKEMLENGKWDCKNGSSFLFAGAAGLLLFSPPGEI